MIEIGDFIARRLRPVVLAAATFMFAASAGGFDLQGHRGARGLLPENTLEGFRHALEIGVTTLEADLAVTRDGVLVVSHDRRLNPDLTRGPDGAWLSGPGPAINALTAAELLQYDVGRIRPGSKYAEQFPAQRAVDGARIPTLAELFKLAGSGGGTVRLNLETKISPDHPDEAPDPDTFAALLLKAVREAGMVERVTIQSFDWRTLHAVHRSAPEVRTVCLTAKSTLDDRVTSGVRRPSPWLAGLDPRDYPSVPSLVKAAGCAVWSPRYTEVTAEAVAEAHALDLKVVPWTVNGPADMHRMVALGVDGLITDYPDRAREVMAARGLPLP